MDEKIIFLVFIELFCKEKLVLCSFYVENLVSFGINYYLCRQMRGKLTLKVCDELRIINLNIII